MSDLLDDAHCAGLQLDLARSLLDMLNFRDGQRWTAVEVIRGQGFGYEDIVRTAVTPDEVPIFSVNLDLPPRKPGGYLRKPTIPLRLKYLIAIRSPAALVFETILLTRKKAKFTAQEEWQKYAGIENYDLKKRTGRILLPKFFYEALLHNI